MYCLLMMVIIKYYQTNQKKNWRVVSGLDQIRLLFYTIFNLGLDYCRMLKMQLKIALVKQEKGYTKSLTDVD